MTAVAVFLLFARYLWERWRKYESKFFQKYLREKINNLKLSFSLLYPLLAAYVLLLTFSYALVDETGTSPLRFITPELSIYFKALLMGCLIMIYGATLYILIYMSNKEFGFYFSKACAIVACSEKLDEEKSLFAKLSVEYYEQYLKRNFQLQINNIDSIYSQIMCFTDDQRQDMTKFISNTKDEDKLDIVKYLRGKFESDSTDEVLVKHSISRRIADYSSFSIPIITILISLFQGITYD